MKLKRKSLRVHCSSCRFFEHTKWINDDVEEGECRRFPASLDAEAPYHPGIRNLWPLVTGIDWCGEHRKITPMNWNPFTSVVNLVGNIAGACKAKWELMTNTWYQQRLDREAAAKAAKATAAQIQADHRAILDDDADAVAKRINAHRALLALPLAACLALAVSGCALFRQPIVVVPQEDVPVAMERNGVTGYWISKPVLMMYMEIADRYEAAKKAGKL